MDPINEIRWVCERCMAKKGRYSPDSADWTLLMGHCNICGGERHVFPVELFSARYAPEG